MYQFIIFGLKQCLTVYIMCPFKQSGPQVTATKDYFYRMMDQKFPANSWHIYFLELAQ